MAIKVIISGGGTGGHIFPAIAIANALKLLAPDTNILFVGANGRMEMEKRRGAGYERFVCRSKWTDGDGKSTRRGLRDYRPGYPGFSEKRIVEEYIITDKS